jgi:hypothetical protein
MICYAAGILVQRDDVQTLFQAEGLIMNAEDALTRKKFLGLDTSSRMTQKDTCVTIILEHLHGLFHVSSEIHQPLRRIPHFGGIALAVTTHQKYIQFGDVESNTKPCTLYT